MDTKYLNITELTGRILIGLLFVMAGFTKISGFEGTAGWMASMGLPMASFLLVLTIILEIGGGIALMIGYKTKTVAFLLTGFTILATLIFHSDFTVAGQDMLFMKNIMIIGGLLHITGLGAGKISLDNRK
jgi:putative oxidoreductase